MLRSLGLSWCNQCRRRSSSPTVLASTTWLTPGLSPTPAPAQATLAVPTHFLLRATLVAIPAPTVNADDAEVADSAEDSDGAEESEDEDSSADSGDEPGDEHSEVAIPQALEG